MVERLNLDALFGQDRPIAVQWQGRDYELARPKAFSPVQWLKWTKLRRESAEYLQRATGDDASAQTEETAQALAVELERVLRLQLDLVCPELAAAKLTFPQVTTVLDFYQSALAAERASTQGDGDPKATPQPTGATSTPS